MRITNIRQITASVWEYLQITSNYTRNTTMITWNQRFKKNDGNSKGQAIPKQAPSFWSACTIRHECKHHPQTHIPCIQSLSADGNDSVTESFRSVSLTGHIDHGARSVRPRLPLNDLLFCDGAMRHQQLGEDLIVVVGHKVNSLRRCFKIRSQITIYYLYKYI